MKYVDSFRHIETDIDTSGVTTYSPWYDVSWANELFSFATFAETGTADSEGVVATLQRYSPIVSTGTDIASHTKLQADGSNEKVVSAKPGGTSAYGTANKLGLRVRWKFVSDGTFGASNVITMTMVLHAKRN